MERKKIYNYDSREGYSDAKVIGGNPNGIFNFNKSNHCFIEGTEVLTSRGFIDFRLLTYNDLVANYEPYTHNITFHKPYDIVCDAYSGYLYEFKSKGYHQIVTPNHRMVKYYTGQNSKNKKAGEFLVEEAANFNMFNGKLPVAGIAKGTQTKLTTLEKVEIAFQADGYWVKNRSSLEKGNSYRFRFKRNYKIKYMLELLAECEDKHIITNITHGNDKDGSTWFSFRSKIKFTKTFNNIDFFNKSKEWGNEFITELSKWDGYVTKYTSVVYSNTNYKAASKVAGLCTITGNCCKIITLEKANVNHKTSYQVYIVRDKIFRRPDGNSGSYIKYNGNVYCCSTDSGYLIVKYNNCISVSGNSWAQTIYRNMRDRTWFK